MRLNSSVAVASIRRLIGVEHLPGVDSGHGEEQGKGDAGVGWAGARAALCTSCTQPVGQFALLFFCVL